MLDSRPGDWEESWWQDSQDRIFARHGSKQNIAGTRVIVNFFANIMVTYSEYSYSIISFKHTSTWAVLVLLLIKESKQYLA